MMTTKYAKYGENFAQIQLTIASLLVDKKYYRQRGERAPTPPFGYPPGRGTPQCLEASEHAVEARAYPKCLAKGQMCPFLISCASVPADFSRPPIFFLFHFLLQPISMVPSPSPKSTKEFGGTKLWSIIYLSQKSGSGSNNLVDFCNNSLSFWCELRFESFLILAKFANELPKCASFPKTLAWWHLVYAETAYT